MRLCMFNFKTTCQFILLQQKLCYTILNLLVTKEIKLVEFKERIQLRLNNFRVSFHMKVLLLCCSCDKSFIITSVDII